MAAGHLAWLALKAHARPLDEKQLRALSPIVVLSPHPDDETLGCGGLLATASRLGLRPRVVFLTDGTASHATSKTWPKSRLAHVRKLEALAALDELGVSAAQSLFLDWPDAAPYPDGHPSQLASALNLLKWFEAFRPKSLWAPWPKEAHCDHQAASDLADRVRCASPDGLRRMDFIVWGWRSETLLSGHGADVVWALPCEEHVARRRRALAQHQTQVSKTVIDAEWSFLMPDDLAALTDRPIEIFLERR